MSRRVILRALLGLALFAGLAPRPAVLAAGPQPITGKAVWLRVDPLQPNTLYVGIDGVHTLIKQSADGGATWQFLPTGAPRSNYWSNCNDRAEAPIIAHGSHDLYTYYAYTTDPVCRTGQEGVVRSADGGRTYSNLGSDTVFHLAEPILATRLYMASGSNGGDYLSEPGCSGVVSTRIPGAATWQKRGKPPVGAPINPLSRDQTCFDLVADPAHPNTVYANTSPVTRSEDAGLTWATVQPPSITPPLKTFAVRYDPAAGDLLEGFSGDAGLPKNRVFLSGDGGRTWTSTVCPGSQAGQCPTIVLHNVFGAGADYAVFSSGIYPFHNAGAAEARLPLGSGWPFTLVQLADMQGGVKAGDPVYALLKDGRLYRSADAGHTWRALAAGTLPVERPTAFPRGSLRAGPYGHAVDPRFIATYRTLGPYLLGYPVDEPYRYKDTLVQDFEHLRLAWVRGRAVVDNLGSDAASYIGCGMGTERPDGYCNRSFRVPPRPNTATLRYFPATGHTVSGDLLKFWQQHGGAAVLGLPLTEVYRAPNGDGSNRTYQMQLFSKARLERHPETHNPRFAILLGLLGIDVLQYRGWLSGSPPNPSY
jgi:hypothetical protein